MEQQMKLQKKRCWRRLCAWTIGTGLGGGLVLLFFDQIPPAGLNVAGIVYLIGLILVRLCAKQFSSAIGFERVERGLNPGMSFVRTLLIVMLSGLTAVLITATFLLTKIEVHRVDRPPRESSPHR